MYGLIARYEGYIYTYRLLYIYILVYVQGVPYVRFYIGLTVESSDRLIIGDRCLCFNL